MVHFTLNITTGHFFDCCSELRNSWQGWPHRRSRKYM